MGNMISRIGLFFDFIGCLILLVESIRNSSRFGEDYIDTCFPVFWKKSYFKNLPIKAFAFLTLGFLLQLIGSCLN
jgi:hypothetical protein